MRLVHARRVVAHVLIGEARMIAQLLQAVLGRVDHLLGLLGGALLAIRQLVDDRGGRGLEALARLRLEECIVGILIARRRGRRRAMRPASSAATV